MGQRNANRVCKDAILTTTGASTGTRLRSARKPHDNEITSTIPKASETVGHVTDGVIEFENHAAGEHALRRRVERALHFLKQPAVVTENVFHLAGFTTQKHFTEVFSGIVGVAPDQYRDAILSARARRQRSLYESVATPTEALDQG
jgi:AraC-like DNA-binding protein